MGAGCAAPPIGTTMVTRVTAYAQMPRVAEARGWNALPILIRGATSIDKCDQKMGLDNGNEQIHLL